MHSVIMTSGRTQAGAGAGGNARIFVPLAREAFHRSASAPRRRSASASAARPTRLERIAATGYFSSEKKCTYVRTYLPVNNYI